MSVEPRVCENAESLAQTVAAALATQIATSHGRFNIALSGGSTPRRLFEILARQHRDTVPWERLGVFWGDERCVPPDSPNSNYRMARDTLLDHVPIPAANVHRMHAELTPPQAAADQYTALLREHLATDTLSLPTFDLVLQGMGEDGHTASLFPGHAALRERSRWVVDVHAEHISPPWRISLTFPVLSRARDVWFVVGGAQKAPILREIFADPVAAAPRYPAAQLHVMAARCTWFTCG